MRFPLAVAALFYVACPLAAPAQAPGPDDYLSHLPGAPRIVGETLATASFRLYGDTTDPEYRDVAPRDGIDDRRGRRLLEVAERFSPILRRNTNHVPRDVGAVLGARHVMHVDSWRDGVKVGGTRVDLGPRLPPGSSSEASPEGAGFLPRVAPDDVRLDSLLRAISPRRVRSGVIRAEGENETILYFDIAGVDEETWRLEHGGLEPTGSRMYVHPFVHDAGGAPGDPRVELVLQYWFFYPYNDGANNHEGDWEHVSVSVTTARRAAEHGASHEHGLLTPADVAAILDPTRPTPVDSLRLRTVAYYFHNNVMVLDYLAVASGEPVASQARSEDGAKHIWEDTTYMEAAVRRRLSLAGGRLATHPIGYIGGNNKGMDELLQARPRFFGSYNRDSHGTYPFPGVWRKVGPVDATEKIFGDVVPRLRPETNPPRPWHDLIDDPRYLTYRAEDLILLPDWERLIPVMEVDAGARREWAWFVLPVHLGFPATASPGAGTLSRVDLGNVAPLGPAYNSAWNRPGATAIYRAYTPFVLRVAVAPISPLASLQSGWGVLNVPIVLWGLMPGGNVAVTQLLPWVTGAMHVLGAPPAKTFALGDLPMRFTSIGAGPYVQFAGDDFARLLPAAHDPAVAAAAGPNTAGTLRRADGVRIHDRGTRVWLNLFYGSKLSIENTFSIGTSELRYTVRGDDDRTLATVTGTLETRELTGGITYRLPPTRQDAFRLYARTGYGWTDYSLDRVAIDSRPVDAGVREGGYMLSLLPSRRWMPNTFYGGLGLELFTPPRYWLLGRLGVGARVEATGLLHRIRPQEECEDCHVTAERGDVSVLLLFAW